MELLHERERAVGELVIELDLAQRTVSRHLRTLCRAGVVSVRVDGRLRLYALRAAPLAELGGWLTRFDVG
jgi:DNA-binding transcriptional ArsR family regulator